MSRSPRIAFSLLTSLSLILGAASVALASSDREFTPGTEVLPIFRGHVEHAKPVRPNANNLSSKGGPIQQVPKVYISYWGPEWAAGFTTGSYTSAQAQTYNNDFFSNIGGSAWNNVVTQYCMGVSSGTQTCPSSAAFITNPSGQLKGTWNDLTAVPTSPTQSQIAAAAARAVAHFSGGTPDPNATYMVYTPSGRSMSGFATSWCAWHSWATVNGAKMAYAYIPYMPDAGSSCGRNFRNSNNAYGNGWFDGFSIVAGHEYSEAETDPFPSSGWVDRQGAENADKCAWSSATANITLGSHPYTVQPTWSNKTGGCAMSAS